MDFLQKLRAHFFKPEPAESLGLFRIVLGLFFLLHIFGRLLWDDVFVHYMLPGYHDAHPLLFWFLQLHGNWLYLPFLICLVCSLGIILGIYSRAASFLFAFAYGYIYLLDRAFYSDGVYLIFLLAVLLGFSNCHHVYSFQRSENDADIAHWNYAMFRFQALLVIFFSALGKANWEWLDGYSLNAFFREGFPHFATIDWTVPLAAFILFSEVFFLLSRSTRIGVKTAWILTQIALLIQYEFCGHEFVNVYLFLIFLLVLFIPPERFERGLRGFSAALLRTHSGAKTLKRIYPQLVLPSLGFFLLIQLGLPFRGLLYPGNVFLTKEGHYGTWSMKIDDVKPIVEKFYIHDPDSRKTWLIDSAEKTGMLSRKQFENLIYPNRMPHFVKILEKAYQEEGVKSPQIYAEVVVQSRLLSRPKTLYDPNVDLTKVSYSVWHHNAWINPLTADN